MREVHSLTRIAWLRVESRLYRIAGQKAIFIAPAWKVSEKLRGREDEEARLAQVPPRLGALEKELDEEEEERIAGLEAVSNVKTPG